MSAREHYLSEFARVAATLPGRRLGWLERARREALDSFATSGLPTQRDEEWKYTSLAALEKGRYAAPAPAPLDEAALASQVALLALADAHVLVFVDGRYAPRLSRPGDLPAGVTLGSLAAFLERDTRCPAGIEALLARPASADASPLAALNAAFMADGAYIHLPSGAELHQPIHLLAIVTAPDAAIHVRHLVRADAGSRASIVEHYVGAAGAAYFTNAVTELVVERGARIEHHRLQDESLKAIHVASVQVDQRRGSIFTSNAYALGGALARADIDVQLNAEEASCVLNGLYLVGGRQHVDHHTRIDHVQPRGVSRELYKGVLDGGARAVFNGKIVVHPNAQHTDAQQANRNLLLSDGAEIDTKPQLEIYADDVKCSHGATVGQLDAEQLFYLRSRGVEAGAARALLTYAFAAEVVGRLSVLPLRTRLEQRLLGRLPEGMEAWS